MNQQNIDLSISKADTHKQLENFKVFPKHVGVWEGTWISLDADGKETQRFKGLLKKEIVDNQWVQTNTYHYADGKSITHNFVGVVAGEGTIKIESSEPPFCNYTMLAEEHDENLIIFKVREKATGVVIGVETINLIDENNCVRTTQGFTAEGKFRGGLMIVERKVG